MSVTSAGVSEDTGPGWRLHLLALLGFFLLALLVTYPVAAQFASGVPGDLVADRDQNLWNLWWVKESLFQPTNPFHTDMLYYPFGADLYYHTLAIPLGLIGLIPQLLFGLPAAYNTVLLAGFTLSGYGMFRLFWFAGNMISPSSSNPARFAAAFLAGMIFAFTPYTLDALKGQPEVLSLQWMPFFVEMWLRAMHLGTSNRQYVIRAALGGFFLALAAYSNLYYAVYLVVFVVLYVVYRLIAVRGTGLRDEAMRIVRVGAVTGGVALVLGLPLLIGLATHRNDPRLAVSADPEHRLAHSADLLSFFAPPHDHLLFGTWQDSPGVNEPALHDYVGLGYVALALAILGAIVAWRKPGTRFWVALGVVALVLAMGPQLQIGRNRTGIPMPFALLEWLPGMDAIAKPERFVVLARLCMAVLAGMGVMWLFRNQRSEIRNQTMAGNNPKSVQWVAALLLIGLVVELPVHPRYMEAVAELPYYQAFETLANQPAGGLMELPFATQQSETTGRRMLLQTVHDKPIMAGYLARRYDSPIIDSCGAFWGFISPLDVPREDIASPLVVNQPLDVLHFYKIRYIALYSSFSGEAGDDVDPDQFEALLNLTNDVTVRDSGYTGDKLVISKVKDESTGSSVPSFHVGASWYPVEQSDGESFRWVQEGHGSLCVFAPQQTTGSLTLQGTAFSQEHTVSMTIGGETIYSGKLPPGAFTPMETTTRTWQAGVTQIDITTPEPGVSPNALEANSGDKRVLTVGFKGVKLEKRVP